MNKLDYFEKEDQIKTHKEIQSIFKELEELEERLHHPEHFIEPAPETQKETEPGTPVIKEPEQKTDLEKPKHEQIRSPRVRRKKKIPQELVKTKWKPKISKIRKKQKPEDLFLPMALRSTFTVRIDEQTGYLVGFPTKKPSLMTADKKKWKLSRRKKEVIEGQPQPEQKPKGIGGKLKRIIPHRKKGKEEVQAGEPKASGIGGKIKGLIPKRKKSKEEKT